MGIFGGCVDNPLWGWCVIHFVGRAVEDIFWGGV